MSYEGYEERLCKDGHYHAYDVYASFPIVCPTCSKDWAFYHGVDQTNGYEEGRDFTYPAKKDDAGFTDLWKEDHYGNKYASKQMKYKPVKGSAWRIFTLNMV